MKIRKVGLSLKVLLICFVATIVCICATSTVSAYDYSKGKKKHEGCYLYNVKLTVNGESYTLRSSLKPVGVPEGITWDKYFSSISIDSYKLVAAGNCYDEERHNTLVAYIEINNEWTELLYYDRNQDKVYYQLEGVTLNKDFYDVKFGFSNRASDYISTGLYVRFAKEYKIFYNLGGGTFQNGTLDSYARGADYTLPTPTRDGYEFVGWTGSDLTTTTKTVVIKNGSTGNKKYTAVWKKKIVETKPKETTTVETKSILLGKSKIKSATKKEAAKRVKVSIKEIKNASGYQIQFSTTRKFKKVLVKKNTKKIKVTITRKKLKNKKKLFVRVKAYRLDGKKKVWAKKWSKVKKVTIKK